MQFYRKIEACNLDTENQNINDNETKDVDNVNENNLSDSKDDVVLDCL